MAGYRRRWRASRVRNVIILLLILPGWASDSPAQQDTTPPTLLDFSFTPTSVDTTSSPATITGTAHITDDLSGLSVGSFVLMSPSQTVGGFFSLESGTYQDGVYGVVATIPAFAEPGIYTAVVSLMDGVAM